MNPEHESLLQQLAEREPFALPKLRTVLEAYEHLCRHHILVEQEAVALRAELAERKKC